LEVVAMNALSRKPLPARVHEGQPATAHRSLLGLLVDMLGQLERGQVGKLSAGSIDSQDDQWEDDWYVYVEAEMPLGPDFEADISIQDGRVFIRMKK
jgi:hypothetical protein